MSAKRFLLVVFSDSGHINPMIAVAQHLERAGHEVVFYSLQEDVSARVARAGLRARCAASPTAALSAPKPEAQRSLKLAKRVTNPSWLKFWTNAVLVEQVPAQVAALRPFVEETRPDIVVADPMAYAAAVAAELAHVPWAAVATGLQSVLGDEAKTSSVYRDIAPARAKMIDALGVRLEFHDSDVRSPWLNTVFAIDALLGDAKRPDALLVGPAIPLAPRGDERDFPFERLPADKPIVFVAFGSQFSHGPAVYEALVSSLSADEAFFVVSAKDLVGESFVKSFPPHVLTVEYAPQLALLERAAVMVNHGGANSVHECLSRGKPMVVVPLAYDQPLFAKLVERAGVGVALDPAAMTAETCRKALLPLLAKDSPARARAEALMREAGNGAARAAELLAEVAETGRAIQSPISTSK